MLLAFKSCTLGLMAVTGIVAAYIYAVSLADIFIVMNAMVYITVDTGTGVAGRRAGDGVCE